MPLFFINRIAGNAKGRGIFRDPSLFCDKLLNSNQTIRKTLFDFYLRFVFRIHRTLRGCQKSRGTKRSKQLV